MQQVQFDRWLSLYLVFVWRRLTKEGITGVVPHSQMRCWDTQMNAHDTTDERKYRSAVTHTHPSTTIVKRYHILWSHQSAQHRAKPCLYTWSRHLTISTLHPQPMMSKHDRISHTAAVLQSAMNAVNQKTHYSFRLSRLWSQYPFRPSILLSWSLILAPVLARSASRYP